MPFQKGYLYERKEVLQAAGCFSLLAALIFNGTCALAAPAQAPAGYKPTAQLGNRDRVDAYQKNYQADPSSDDRAYLFKTAEWTDKEKGEAKLRITAKWSKIQELKSTAVYVMTDCTAHGFVENIAHKNIQFLLKNYDQVDVVVADGFNSAGIKIFENVSDAACLNQVTFAGSRHYNLIAYQGLYDYLMGVRPGTETGAETQKRFPTAIYVSFDSRVTAGTGERFNGDLPDFDTIDCMALLKEYDRQGRYFSMSGCAKGDTNKLGVFNFTAPFLQTNIIAALMDPQCWPGAAAAKTAYFDGSTTLKMDETCSFMTSERHITNSPSLASDVPVTSDFMYNQTFEEGNVPVVAKLMIEDTLGDAFELASVEVSDPTATTTAVGSKLTVDIGQYDGSGEVEVILNVKLKDLTDEKILGKWTNTNLAKAVVRGLEDDRIQTLMEVDSPKLFKPGAPKPPVTGDSARPELWIALGLLSLTALGALVFLCKKYAGGKRVVR